MKNLRFEIEAGVAISLDVAANGEEIVFKIGSRTEQLSTYRSVEKLIEQAGGPHGIQDSTAGEITADAVYKWKHIGIAEKNWSAMMFLTGATEQELHSANLAVRQKQAVK